MESENNILNMYYASLNSGSNGNCYYISNEQESVLIDAGLSCRETEKRLQALGESIKKIKAIFISHEHTDHIKGVQALSTKFHLPVYISEKTLHRSKLQIEPQFIRYLNPDEPIQIGNLLVKGFSKKHDAADPYSFIVSNETNTIGIFTDIGSVCDNVKTHFQKCHAAFLEANYDENLLESGPYPIHLKKRIKSDSGHLSNLQALELFTNHRSSFLSHLLLSHISQENNHPDIIKTTFQNSEGVKIEIASRTKETPLFTIDTANKKTAATNNSLQLLLF
jgi:phosphoribosyl 1,2-cyclic phosphodiesterase